MGLGEVGEKLRRSTVQITRPRGTGSGSGFVWNSDGTILTNAHAVGDATTGIGVELWDGRKVAGRVTARDPARDLASVAVDRVGVLPALPLREGTPRPGEVAIAVGNPLGFTGALTTGVIHGIGPIPGLGRSRRWVQAAVRLAPGNSGGPLADADGRVIGMNTMVLPGGLALAVPAAVLARFATRGEPPKLGVAVRATKAGLLVCEVVRGGAAERASLLPGDILIAVEGVRLQDESDLAEVLAAPPGRALRLGFLRGGQTRERAVTVSLDTGRAAAA